eukprot:761509_1
MWHYLATISSLIWLTYSQHECTESNTWINLPNVPTQTGEVASVIINDALYVAGEENTDTYKYDFTTNNWSKLASRIYPGNHQNSFTYNNEWWLVGGIDANSYGKVQVYHPTEDKWYTKPDMPWDGGSVCVAFINNTIYACGGIWLFNNGKNGGGTNTTNKCAKYVMNSGNGWQMETKMPYRRNHAATSTDGKGNMWIFGGREGKNVPSNGYPTVQVYDTINQKWTTSNDTNHPYSLMTIGRGGTGHAVYNNGKFYVFGGETGNNPGGYATKNLVYNRTDIYDVASNKWTTGKDMPYPRHGIFPVLYKDAIYIAAGGPHNGHYVSNTFDKYCI